VQRCRVLSLGVSLGRSSLSHYQPPFVSARHIGLQNGLELVRAGRFSKIAIHARRQAARHLVHGMRRQRDDCLVAVSCSFLRFRLWFSLCFSYYHQALVHGVVFRKQQSQTRRSICNSSCGGDSAITGIASSYPRSPYPSDGLTRIRTVGGFNMCAAANPDSRFVTEGRDSRFPRPDRH
jgi:hypothetical protein